MNALTLEIRQYPLQMIIYWDIWHHDFSPRKTSRFNCTQSQEINNAKPAQNLFKKMSSRPKFIRRFLGLWCNKKSCDFGGSRFSFESAELKVRLNRDSKADKPSDKPINLLLLVSPAPLPKRVVGKVPPHLSPHPAATPGKGKYIKSPFVCFFCLFCVWGTYVPPKVDDSLSLSHERWEMREGFSLSGFLEKPIIINETLWMWSSGT